MSTLDKLDNLGLPERTATVELVSNPLNELKASYDAWCSIVKPVANGKAPIEIANILYDEAISLTSKKTRGISSEDVMSVAGRVDKSILKRSIIRTCSGLYFTALLNNSCLDELTANGADGIEFIGYRLNKGKIVIKENHYDRFVGYLATGGIIENHCDAGYTLGHFASGGVFINYGSYPSMGDSSEGGLFVNNGIVIRMGHFASGGVFINNKKVKLEYFSDPGGALTDYDSSYGIGYLASGGVFINMGEVEYCMGHFAQGGLFIAKEMPKEGFMHQSKPAALGIGPKKLESDKQLQNILNSILESASQQNYLEAEQSASIIKKYCNRA